MSVKPTLAAALALVLVGTALEPAHAELNGELAPSVAVGVTSNAQANSARASDELVIVGVFSSLRARTPRTSHVLGSQVSFTHYIEGMGTDTLSATLSEVSSFQLSREWDLTLGAGAMLSRTSRLDLLALATGGPQAATTGSSLFLGSNANQGLTFQPNAFWRFSQNAGYARVDYLATTNLLRRPAASLTGGLRIDYIDRRNDYSLDLRAIDLMVGEAPATATLPARPAGHSLLTQGLLGWRREFSLEWSGQLQGGVAMLFDQNGPDVWTPAGALTVDYRRQLWFANLVVARTPVANMFSALATINNQAFLHLTLPLSRSELLVVGGFAGLVWAQLVNAEGNLERAFNQRSAGFRVGKRFKDLPLVAAFDYSVLDQNATAAAGGADVVRHLAIFHLAGTFQFGPGTPPIVGGGLYQGAAPR